MRTSAGPNRDVCAGLLFLAIGLVAVAVAGRYPIGTASRMGPGYFPMLLGVLLALLGLGIAIRGLWHGAPGVGPIALRPLLSVTAAVVGFGVLLERVGLAVAAFVLVLAGTAAGWRSSRRELVLLYLVLLGLGAGLFIRGLGLPLRL